MQSSNYLLANNREYECLLAQLSTKNGARDPESILRRVSVAAALAAEFHTGRFADGAIENIATWIGKTLRPVLAHNLDVATIRNDGRRRILHVASHVRGIGGHSRILYQWVRNDRSSCHSLVVLQQERMIVPEWLAEAIRKSGGNLVVLPTTAPLVAKAFWLRDIARRTADLVALHHGANDVLPTVAFAVPDCPPVTVVNQADHQFWLGSGVTDAVINLRRAAVGHTAERRLISTNVVIPTPLEDPKTNLSRYEARRRLGIPNDQIVLLSVARVEKYRPCESYDFVCTVNKILKRHSNVHLYAVGESPAGIKSYLRCDVHERLHFVGRIEDPLLYRLAADIFLETFPFGTQTALLEAALAGLPVVTAYKPLFPLLVANVDALTELIPNPVDEDAYVESVDILLQRNGRRRELGAILRERLYTEHIGEGWLQRLTNGYRTLDCLKHVPRCLPATPCNTSDSDVGLSLWHAMADGRTYSLSVSDQTSRVAVLRHSAGIAKYSNNYTRACRYAWNAVQYSVDQKASWQLLATTLIGKPKRHIQHFVRTATSKHLL